MNPPEIKPIITPDSVKVWVPVKFPRRKNEVEDGALGGSASSTDAGTVNVAADTGAEQLKYAVWQACRTH